MSIGQIKVKQMKKKAQREQNSEARKIEKEKSIYIEQEKKAADEEISKNLNVSGRSMSPNEAREFKNQMKSKINDIEESAEEKFETENSYSLKNGFSIERDFSLILSNLIELSKNKALEGSEKIKCKKLIEEGQSFYSGIDAKNKQEFQREIKKYIKDIIKVIDKFKISNQKKLKSGSKDESTAVELIGSIKNAA